LRPRERVSGRVIACLETAKERDDHVTPGDRRSRQRLGLPTAFALGLACLAEAVAAPAASAVNTQLKEEFAPFLDCPTATATVCTVAQTTSGEFKMGSKDVPIEKPITLQGGLPIS
jgi:hypothetical protein